MKKLKQSNFSNFIKKNKFPFIIVLVIFSLLTLKSKLFSPLNINEVSNSNTTTIEGVLVKDSPAGSLGNFYLLLDSGQVVNLYTSTNLDQFEGSIVRATGSLLPQDSSSTMPILAITQLEKLSSQQN